MREILKMKKYYILILWGIFLSQWALADKDSKLCSFSAGQEKYGKEKSGEKIDLEISAPAEVVDFSSHRSKRHAFNQEKQAVAQIMDRSEYLSALSEYQNRISDSLYLKLKREGATNASGRYRSLIINFLEIDPAFLSESLLPGLRTYAEDVLVERHDTKDFMHSLYFTLLKKFSFNDSEKMPEALKAHILKVLFLVEAQRDAKNTNLLLKIFSSAAVDSALLQAEAKGVRGLKVLLRTLGAFPGEMAMGVFTALNRHYDLQSLEFLFQSIDGQLLEGGFSSHVSKERVLSLYSKGLDFVSPEMSKEKILEQSFYAVEDMLMPAEFLAGLESLHETYLEQILD